MKRLKMEEILDIVNFAASTELTIEQIDEPLFNLGIDSLTFIKIVLKIEDESNGEIPDTRLSFPEMNTIHKIFNLLQELYEIQSSH